MLGVGWRRAALNKDRKDSAEPRDISVSHLFDHTMSSKATCALTELVLAANHVCRRTGGSVCGCLCARASVYPCLYYRVAVIRPKCQTESVVVARNTHHPVCPSNRVNILLFFFLS